MSAHPPDPYVPVTSVAETIARMEAIDAVTPPDDGLACFSRMYLEVTCEVNNELGQRFYADQVLTTMLDVEFANLYFDAVGAADKPATAPLAWRPLVEQRAETGIEPIQFALAGMNANINHDLPPAVVGTCTDLATPPTAGAHLADHQKVDRLLDTAEQSIRQSFESVLELELDLRLKTADNIVASRIINSCRDLARRNALLPCQLRHSAVARELLLDRLATSVALASRLLLVAV
ncbi:MAG TPA: DUF5995 family protein [Streptosporangiaceae bacterium]|nr:DUF5995 family protein [Streptosporangiaceae bacterium]